MLVPYGAPAGGPPHDAHATTRLGGGVIAARGLVATERKARRVEPIEPQERLAPPVGALQEGHVESHVLGARASPRLEQQLPPNGGRAPRGAAPARGRPRPRRPPRRPPPPAPGQPRPRAADSLGGPRAPPHARRRAA